MKEIVELWILHESGICLFHYSLEEKVDPILFGGFFTAINQYSAAMSKSGAIIQDISMGNFLLTNYVVPDYKLSFVARCKQTKHRKAVRKTLEDISGLFKGEFEPEEISGWNGNTTEFDKFQPFVEKYFNNDEMIVERMRAIF